MNTTVVDTSEMGRFLMETFPDLTAAQADVLVSSMSRGVGDPEEIGPAWCTETMVQCTALMFALEIIETKVKDTDVDVCALAKMFGQDAAYVRSRYDRYHGTKVPR